MKQITLSREELAELEAGTLGIQVVGPDGTPAGVLLDFVPHSVLSTEDIRTQDYGSVYSSDEAVRRISEIREKAVA